MTEQDKPQMNEREAIVAFLRDIIAMFQQAVAETGLHEANAPIQTITEIANAIERGDHLKGKSDER